MKALFVSNGALILYEHESLFEENGGFYLQLKCGALSISRMGLYL